MIIFERLRYKNLLSTGNQFTEIELNTSSNTLMVGENGSGKSTVIEAISFVLFNKPYRNINKPNLVNSITDKNLVVEVEFTIGKDEYKIIRGMKPNRFEVYKNDTLLNQSADNRDYQEILEKQILKVNHKTFCQVVILGTASFIPFMQLPAHARREIVEDILDLKIFSLMNSALKSKVQANESAISSEQTEMRVLSEKIKLIKHHAEQMAKSNSKLVAEKRERIEKTLAEIKVDMDKINELEAKAEDLKIWASHKDDINKELETVRAARMKITHKIDKLIKDNDFYKCNDNCPTCSQKIDENFKAEKIEAGEESIAELNAMLEKVEKKWLGLNSQIDEIYEVERSLNSVVVELNKHKSHSNSLKSYVRELEQDIQSINEEVKSTEGNELKRYVADLKSRQESYNTLMEEKANLSVVSALLKDGGIKARIIKQYVPIINKLINKYLSMMDFFVNFSLNEKFEETILSRNRDNFSYSSFSEGEKFRINLAILFTWRAVAKLRNSINTNILFMDEVMDSSLDASGTEEFLKIINQFSEDTNVFIISHKGDQLFDKFETVLKFEKHNNFSKMRVL